MITEQDLQEAIAECEGQRNPNANTCMKLAAFYTIRDQLFSKEVPQEPMMYSYAPPPQGQSIAYTSNTEFSEMISDKEPMDVWAIMDELMTTLSVINPRLYDSVIRKLNQI